jgi:general secretion pathway protein K
MSPTPPSGGWKANPSKIHRPRGLMSRPPSRQRGIAMLVAVLLVALGTIIAAAIAYESAMATRRGTATISFDEALLVGEGAEALAAYGLRSVMQTQSSGAATGANTSGQIYASQPWAQPVGPLEVVPGVTLEAQLEDMQGRFNLNWLVSSDGVTAGKADPDMVQAFDHLLQLVGIQPKWADLIVDWIDADTAPLPDGAEDSAYMGQNPPYLTANQYITSTSELLALPGFGHDNYVKLEPYISALPANTTLNTCTAPGAVLDAFTLGQQNFSSDENAFEKNRSAAAGCFPDAATYGAIFTDKTAFSKYSARFKQTSNFFRLTSLVTIGTSEFNLYSLLYMDANGPLIHPVQRSFSPD